MNSDISNSRGLTTPRPRETLLNLALYRGLKWGVVRPLLHGLFQAKVYGQELVPSQGPALVVSNHASYFDPPFLSCAMARPVAFMAKEELFNVPLLGPAIRLYGAYPVKRSSGDRGALRAALTALGDGWLVGVFLEGTRTDDGRIHQPKLGAAMIAAKAQVPIIPVSLGGVEGIFQPGSGWPHPVPLTIRIGQAIAPPAKNKKPELEAVTRICQEQINQMLDLGRN
ncbi:MULTISPECIES: 1-acyl-sn-glycerol-3-phosphate acyltransferase [unclassified Synechocystis]|uniref:lysophospholipid acyltransferase family protein n=1 Tax=Synechocystis sp. (strain PCC 6714) TaxID=1147 RepID=UPI00068D7282|nr:MULTISPECIES: lysophospholipid acyltransferase family protein [unclassified Synechocystis]MCT0253559.1 1-acyl-sn-glycerol-3-phosphate acyltransferase [Synechocystis sp. CS-94]